MNQSVFSKQASGSLCRKRFYVISLLLFGLFTLWSPQFSKASTQKSHKIPSIKMYHHYFLQSPCQGEDAFCMNTTPGPVSIYHGTVHGQRPGLTTLIFSDDHCIKERPIFVKGFLQECYYLKEGSQTNLSVFGIPSKSVSRWTSSNPGIASIRKDGTILAKRPGMITITCKTTDRALYQTSLCVLSGKHIESLIEKSKQKSEESEESEEPYYSFVLTCNESTLLMHPGSSYQPSVTVRKLDQRSANPEISWSSNDTSVATVDKHGKISAHKDGMAIITCQADDQELAFSVNVISNGKSGNSCELTLLTGNDTKKRTYTLFKQNAHTYDKYDTYLAWHGCSHCSLTTVLSGYNENYAHARPDHIIDTLEKKYADSNAWSKNYEKKSLRHQMPLTLSGMSTLMKKAKVQNDYVASFRYPEARADILSHLRSGHPVLFEVRMKNHRTKKSSKRWTNSYHTMVFLGAFTDDQVLLCDSVDRSWYDGGQRYKIVDLDDVMDYMFSSTKTTKKLYFNGAASDGGYIKIYE